MLNNQSKEPDESHKKMTTKNITTRKKLEKGKDELEILENNLIELLRDHLYKIRSSLLPSFSF